MVSAAEAKEMLERNILDVVKTQLEMIESNIKTAIFDGRNYFLCTEQLCDKTIARLKELEYVIEYYGAYIKIIW